MMRPGVFCAVLLFGLSLQAFDVSTLESPKQGDFHLPVTGFFVDDTAREFTFGGGVALLYGVGGGFSAGLSWIQPFSFAADVLSETAFSFTARYDVAFGPENMFNLFLRGGGMVYGAADFVVPVDTGLSVHIRWIRFGAGSKTLFDIDRSTELMVWAALGVDVMKQYSVQARYARSLLRNRALDNMVSITFTFRL